MSVPKKEALHRPASNANTYEKLKREGGQGEGQKWTVPV